MCLSELAFIKNINTMIKFQHHLMFISQRILKKKNAFKINFMLASKHWLMCWWHLNFKEIIHYNRIKYRSDYYIVWWWNKPLNSMEDVFMFPWYCYNITRQSNICARKIKMRDKNLISVFLIVLITSLSAF